MLSWDQDYPYEEVNTNSRSSSSSGSNPLPSKYPSRRSIREEAPCKITHVQNKGLGLVAIRQIEAGELVLQERPLFRLWQPEPSHSDILQQVRQLGPADRDQFYSLSNSEEDESIPEEKGIWVTNSFQIDNTYKGIFPIASRINSSCRPNLFYTQDHAITGLQFRALRTIQANEELCHAYIPELHVRSKRRKLYRNWGFTCMCELCEAPEEEVEESDQRIRMINRLDEIIDRPRDASTLSDKDYWSAIWRLLHLLKLEGRLQLRFDVVCTAYKRAVAARDAAQCRTWAKRCYKYGKLQFGHRDTRTREWAKRVCSWEVKLNNIKEASAEL